jgi:hypothetical protein
MIKHLLHQNRPTADQGTCSIFYFYKGWSLTNEGGLGRGDARKIAENGMLWQGRPGAVGQSTLDRPAPSRLDLSLSRDFLQTKS